jgi:hypothetical protein
MHQVNKLTHKFPASAPIRNGKPRIDYQTLEEIPLPWKTDATQMKNIQKEKGILKNTETKYKEKN